jgi:hypothetical protein
LLLLLLLLEAWRPVLLHPNGMGSAAASWKINMERLQHPLKLHVSDRVYAFLLCNIMTP